MAPRSEGTNGRLVSRSTRVPAPPFRALVADAERPRTVWTAPDEPTVVGGGAAALISASGPGRFEAVRSAATDLFSSGDVHAGSEAARPRLFGGFSFHADATGDPPWNGFPGAQFVFPRVQVTYGAESAWLTVNAVGPNADPEAVEERLATERDRMAGLETSDAPTEPPGIEHTERTTDREAWRETVSTVLGRIREGELRKVVLAQALAADLAGPLSVPDLLERLGEAYPDCHRFLFEPAEGGASFFGATPELLVTLRGRTVRTGALAGTTGRGDTPAEDEWLAGELLADEKNRHEHDLVAEAIEDQLAGLSSSVMTGQTTVRRLATVQHLFTPITAELAEDEHVLSLVEALHPTPAVGGLPPDRALSTIRETEPFDRGWYAAPVGWLDAAGYGSFAVALRSALTRERRATLFAGVGIVADSDPDREWEEVQLKYRPILDQLDGG